MNTQLVLVVLLIILAITGIGVCFGSLYITNRLIRQLNEINKEIARLIRPFEGKQ